MPLKFGISNLLNENEPPRLCKLDVDVKNNDIDIHSEKTDNFDAKTVPNNSSENTKKINPIPEFKREIYDQNGEAKRSPQFSPKNSDNDKTHTPPATAALNTEQVHQISQLPNNPFLTNLAQVYQLESQQQQRLQYVNKTDLASTNNSSPSSHQQAAGQHFNGNITNSWPLNSNNGFLSPATAVYNQNTVREKLLSC